MGVRVAASIDRDAHSLFIAPGWRARSAVRPAIVAGSVLLSKDGKVIRVHPIRND
ncbi:MAG TPA: hypothetical protein VGS19_19400 [Streptosporangiaceae bacterium]|nr:hypothetical protein [Streptosporangiaceae bacterium]